jgi:predicted transport protein
MKAKKPQDMMAAVSNSMKERTGRTIADWVALVQSSGPDSLDQLAVRRWLKTEHGVLQNSQWAIADAAARVAGWRPPTTEEYIDKQYSGAKAALRPIFDALREAFESMADDVGIGGRSTYITFVRSRQFAAVAAATRTRVDVGLRFTDPPDSGLLSSANAPGQATHKLSLTGVGDVSDGVRLLLRLAYEQNG